MCDDWADDRKDRRNFGPGKFRLCDTNSTMAGTIAASKLHIKIAHVDTGLQSFNRRMAEEVNRILTDRISSILFCPTQTSVNNLNYEGIKNWKTDPKVSLVGLPVIGNNYPLG